MNLREAGKDAVGGDDVVHVACSICLDAVKTGGDRSTARLQCGHAFHLDCIGSAFNAKGSMQCPNCRKVEEGNWLYANGSRPTPEFTVDEWTQDEDLYSLSYPETPFECFWGPFGGSLARIPSMFEEGESSPAVTFRDLLGHPAIFTEPQAAVSATHLCPLLAYTRVVQPPTSSGHSFEARINGPGYHPQWSHLQRPRDTHIPHIMAPSNLHYPGWEHHLSYPLPDAHIGSADLASQFPQLNSDGFPTADSVFCSFACSHGLGSRAGATSSSMPTLVAAPYSRNHGAVAREHYQLQNSRSAQGPGIPPLQGSLRSFNPAGQCSPFLILPTTLPGQANADAESLQSSRLYSQGPTCWGHFVPAGGALLDSNPPPAFFPSNVSERPPAQAAGYSSSRPVPPPAQAPEYSSSRPVAPVRMLSLM